MYANIVVEDLAGLGMSHMYTPGIDLFKKIIAMDQNNYPDTLKVRLKPLQEHPPTTPHQPNSGGARRPTMSLMRPVSCRSVGV
jgi:hypothetical protein